MQELTTPTPSQTELDAVDQVSALLMGEPEKEQEPEPVDNSDAPEPEKEEAEAPPDAPEKAEVDYGMQVPITGGEPVTLGELKDAWQDRQAAKLELIERENAVTRGMEQANALFNYIGNLPPDVVELAGRQAEMDKAEQLGILHRTIPETRTPEGAEAIKQSLYALSAEYDTPVRAIDEIKHAGVIRMLRDYVALKASIKAARDNVKPLRSDNPTARPSAPAAPSSDLQRAIARAKQTGSKQDAADAIDQLLRSA